jgi:hypothetical protein
MSNSKLVNYTQLSPNCSKPRNHVIDKLTIHHMAGNLTVEQCGSVFAPASRKASANYGIGTDGRVGLYVDEANRSWCSSNSANDNRAVTIEVANDEVGGNWHVSDTALAKLIDLCVDICQRNGISRINYTGDKSGNLTMHKWFAATACPGPYLESKFPYIAEQINARLGSTQQSAADTSSDELPYRVRVVIPNLNIRKGPGTNYGTWDITPARAYSPLSRKPAAGCFQAGACSKLSGWPEWLDIARLCGKALTHRFKARRENPAGPYFFRSNAAFLSCDGGGGCYEQFFSHFSAKRHFDLHWVVRTEVLRLEDKR